MAYGTLDGDCRRCHPSFAEREDSFGAPAFHELSLHNVELGVSCVSCHHAHAVGGDPDGYFLQVPAVREQCAHCHPEFEKEGE